MYKMIWRLDQNCSVYLPLFISINSFLSVSGNLLFLAALINIMTPRKLERNVYFAAFLTLFSEVCHRQGDVKQCFRCLLNDLCLITSAIFTYVIQNICL